MTHISPMEEITNMIKKILSDVEDNKHQKRRHGIFCNVPHVHLIPRRLDDGVSKNSRASKKNRVKYSIGSDTSSN